MNQPLPIVAVNFTFACPGGLWVRREGRMTSDGFKQETQWVPDSQLIKEVGEQEAKRLHKVAYANGMTGMWYNAENGRNCYVNGVLVN